MPPKKKSTVKGPFFFYMLEFKQRQQANGKDFPGGMDQVMCEAGPSWNQLSEKERDVYKQLANKYKKSKQGVEDKYTTHGVAFTIIDKQQKERFIKGETMRKSISEMIQTAVCNNTLEKMKVYFISINYFCKTNSGLYVPAEMAIVRYNLELGVLDKLHEMINPGQLPLGMAHEANIQSDETHQLPIPPNALGETDFSVCFEKLLTFIECEKNEQKRFLFFTDSKEVHIVENVMKQFKDESKTQYNILICPLGEFFYQLKTATESYGLDIRTFPAKTIAEILLKKDSYEYTSGIACEFHEKLGNPRFCALSKAIRWSYIVSDNCCLDLSIDLIPGRHLPLNADTTLCSDLESKSFQSDRMSFISSSDMTHISLPNIQKIYTKSPYLGDENGSVIYSSREGITKDEKKIDTSKIGTVPTNPFHTVDFDKIFSEKSEHKVYNPFNYMKKQKTSLENDNMTVVIGHGRGTLLRGYNNEAKPGPSGLLSRSGRGLSLLTTKSTLSTLSSTLCSDTDDQSC